MKKVFALSLIMLTGCTSHEEIVQKIQEEYKGLNCEQLTREHESLERMKTEAEDAENPALNVAVALVFGPGAVGNGKAKIEEYSLKLEVISGLMQQKDCDKKRREDFDKLNEDDIPSSPQTEASNPL
ncbi:hypothetical protein FACS1894122_09910 [Alphaproteobacteria bacterium]|nr:hypothetical protein FACS1894122_09910 [Alphaproteobacteria bacterium]